VLFRSQLIDRPVDDLVKLNPQLQRWTTPANDPGFILNLPAGTAEKLGQAIAVIPPDKRIWWRAHKVESGETLADIARKYKLSPVVLAHANQLSQEAGLEAGAHLVLPMAVGSAWSLQRVHQRGSHRVYYRVRPNDTLELVADRFEVTPYQLRRWNSLRSSRLTPGKMLKVYIAGMGIASSSGPHRKRKSHGHYMAHGKTLSRSPGHVSGSPGKAARSLRSFSFSGSGKPTLAARAPAR